MSPPKNQSDDADDSREVAAIERGRILAMLTHLDKELTEVKSMLERRFVTRDEFAPIKGIVYGFVALILVAVIGALVALVVRKP